jgi:4-amino-4-deoxy-L-arabinose transferase-like glycosyltransferase
MPVAGLPAAGRRGRRLAVVWSVGIALLGYGLLMSFWRLDVTAWNGDELTYARAGSLYWQGEFRYNTEHPPFGKEIIGASELIFGQTLWAARLPSAVALLAGGIVLGLWLGRAATPVAGLIAAALWWSLPSLTGFPEAFGSAASLARGLPMRLGLLDPLAGFVALVALAFGWWWIRSGRPLAGAACGLASGLAVATKFSAALIVVVPAVVGCLALLRDARPMVRRLLRAAGHGALWTLATATAFVLTYAPMGYHQAREVVLNGWRFQRHHGMSGHLVVVMGKVYRHAPWWTLGWWQYAAWGLAAVLIALVVILAALVLRSTLVCYLTAAAVLPMAVLAPFSGLALPHYILVWRGPLIAVVAVAITVVLGWVRTHTRPLAAGVAALLVVAPFVAVGHRTVTATLRLHPEGYAALAEFIPAGTGDIWHRGFSGVMAAYLPGRHFVSATRTPTPGRPQPAAIVLDRAVTQRIGDGGLAAWAEAHGYEPIHASILDIWIHPPGREPNSPQSTPGMLIRAFFGGLR